MVALTQKLNLMALNQSHGVLRLKGLVNATVKYHTKNWRIVQLTTANYKD